MRAVIIVMLAMSDCEITAQTATYERPSVVVVEPEPCAPPCCVDDFEAGVAAEHPGCEP